MDEPDRGGKLLANDLLPTQPKKASHWTILMVEVNWDYHRKGKRFMFKETESETKLMQASTALQDALQRLAMMRRSDRLQAAALGNGQPGPPAPGNYPVSAASRCFLVR